MEDTRYPDMWKGVARHLLTGDDSYKRQMEYADIIKDIVERRKRELDIESKLREHNRDLRPLHRELFGQTVWLSRSGWPLPMNENNSRVGWEALRIIRPQMKLLDELLEEVKYQDKKDTDEEKLLKVIAVGMGGRRYELELDYDTTVRGLYKEVHKHMIQGKEKKQTYGNRDLVAIERLRLRLEGSDIKNPHPDHWPDGDAPGIDAAGGIEIVNADVDYHSDKITHYGIRSDKDIIIRFFLTAEGAHFYSWGKARQAGTDNYTFMTEFRQALLRVSDYEWGEMNELADLKELAAVEIPDEDAETEPGAAQPAQAAQPAPAAAPAEEPGCMGRFCARMTGRRRRRDDLTVFNENPRGVFDDSPGFGDAVGGGISTKRRKSKRRKSKKRKHTKKRKYTKRKKYSKRRNAKRTKSKKRRYSKKRKSFKR